MRLFYLLIGALAIQAQAGPPILHSHNDYQQKLPLVNALVNHFESVEADIWLDEGDIRVSHIGFSFVGTLKELYLDPLQERISEKGSVHGDGKPFYLWLDIKGRSNPELLDKLQALLLKYPMLTTFTDQKTTEGPVTAILSGNDQQKKTYVEKFAVRKACRDSNDFSITDPKADNRWSWYSIRWSDLFKWQGRRKIDGREQAYLMSLVDYIHEKGRKVRFWDTPETEDFWKLAVHAKVDVIGTDQVPRLGEFVRAQFPSADRQPAAGKTKP